MVVTHAGTASIIFTSLHPHMTLFALHMDSNDKELHERKTSTLAHALAFDSMSDVL